MSLQRNAMRLNGTATVNSGPSATRTRTGSGAGATGASTGGNATPSATRVSGAERAAGLGFVAVVPMAAVALLL